MNPPSRGGAPDVRRLLIDSAKHDAPSPRTLRKARAAVLLAASAAATSTSVATAAATGVIRWAVVLKWLGIGVLAGATTIGAVKLVGRQAPAPVAPSTAPIATLPVAVPPVVFAPVASAQPAAPSHSARVEAAPHLPMAPSAEVESEPPPAASAPPVASSQPSLAEEVAMLDEARKAVATGRGADAIQALDRYQRDYPRGRLGHEAAFVRMQALMLTGNRAAAEQMAEQFLRASPNSPLAPRVRELIR